MFILIFFTSSFLLIIIILAIKIIINSKMRFEMKDEID